MAFSKPAYLVRVVSRGPIQGPSRHRRLAQLGNSFCLIGITSCFELLRQLISSGGELVEREDVEIRDWDDLVVVGHVQP